MHFNAYYSDLTALLCIKSLVMRAEKTHDR